MRGADRDQRSVYLLVDDAARDACELDLAYPGGHPSDSEKTITPRGLCCPVSRWYGVRRTGFNLPDDQ